MSGLREKALSANMAVAKRAGRGVAPLKAMTNVFGFNFVALTPKTFFPASILQVWSQEYFSKASDL
jgi:hypothetical protein